MKKIILGTIALIGICSVSSTFACKCMMPENPQKELTKSESVFVGKVEKIETKYFSEKIIVSFKVNKTFKGEKNLTKEIKTSIDDGASCGYKFEKGKEYIVYTDKGQNGERVSLCSRTNLLKNAKEDLEALEKKSINTLSLNDRYLKQNLEKNLNVKYKNSIKKILDKYYKNLSKFSVNKQIEINNRVIDKINEKITELLLKYPQDITLPKKVNTIYMVLNYVKLSLMEKKFETNKKEINQTSLNLVKVLTKADISTQIPAKLGSIYTKNFVKYTALTTPNGGKIYIVAQDKISDEQILRARGILEHYLRNYKGSKYGEDKSKVANKMAENNAVLALLNGADDGKNPVGAQVTGQPLYQNEMQTEGGDWYTKQNYEHRDASYEEILHFVHDNGIGVDGNDEFRGVLATYQAEIRKAEKNALAKNFWGRGEENKSWIKELSAENSLTQEYLASVIDSYYGLWGARNEGKGGMWNIYIAKTRDDIASKEKMGYELLNNKFFHPYITYNARIEPSFEGTFSLKFDAKKPYTHHSRYLKDITLLGNKNTSVVVNELDNYITGNKGKNIVIFSGKQSEYKISKNGIMTIIEDTIKNRDGKNRDGKNTLENIEKLKFSDGEKSL